MKFCSISIILSVAIIAFFNRVNAEIIQVDEDFFIQSVDTDVSGLVKYEHIRNVSVNDTRSTEEKSTWASIALNFIHFHTSFASNYDHQKCLFNMRAHASSNYNDSFVHYQYGKCSCSYILGSDIDKVRQTGIGGMFLELEILFNRYSQWQDSVLEANVDDNKNIVAGTVHCGSDSLKVVARRLNHWKKGVQVTNLKLIRQEKKWYAENPSHEETSTRLE